MKNVVILSLIFSPDNVSTAQIMAGLAEDLKKCGCGVKVVSTTPHFHRDPSLEAEQPLRWAFWPFVKKSDYHGVRVYHVPMPDKSIWPPLRLLSWIWFHIVSTFVCLFTGKIDVLIACTPPLTIGLGAWLVGVLKRCRYVFNVQEVYPDIAVNLGYMKNRLVIRFFKWLERFIYKHAGAVTTITPSMYEKIVGRVADKGKVRLIPNYVELEADAARSVIGPYQIDVQDGRAASPRRPPGASGAGGHPFTVTYAGNMGVPQNLGVLVEAVRAMPDVRLLFVGDGGDRKRLEKLAEGMDNVEFRGYRPLSEMPGVYAESDLFYVGQDAHAAADGIPSKIYRILGARKPLVVVAPPDGDLAAFVRASGGGVATTDDGLADTIRQMRTMDLAAMGEAGYRYVKEGFSREKITGMYATLVEELA